jgi:uncharacterized RDD family membrane protein YckC
MSTEPVRYDVVHAGVVTPEAVLLELPTAGVATRALARAVDLVIQVVLLVALALVVSFVAPPFVSPVLLVLVIGFLVLLVYPIGVEILWRGRSPGKFVFGLRVVGADGAPEVPRQAVVRGLVALVDIYGSLGFLAAVSAMTSESSQRPGDLAAGTVVIRVGNASLGSGPIAFHPPPGYESYVATLDVGTLDDEAFSLIREFLLRSADLEPSIRHGLALELATAVLRRTAHTLPGTIDAEVWLVCVASAYQLRQGGLLSDAAAGLAPLAPRVAPTAPADGRRHRGR